MARIASIQVGDLAAVPVSDQINVVYGSAATKLTKPAGKKVLVACSKKGSWGFRQGDLSGGGMPAAHLSGAAVTNNSSSWPLLEGATITLAVRGTDVTVKAYAADSELAYFWA